MSHNSFGNLLKFTTWGESHGEAIGCVVDGFPANIPVDLKYIKVVGIFNSANKNFHIVEIEAR